MADPGPYLRNIVEPILDFWWLVTRWWFWAVVFLIVAGLIVWGIVRHSRGTR